jgi:deoxyribonuclease-4
MSLHTPYFISLSGVDPEKRLKSIDYIQKSLWAAELLCADTIVIHSGSAAKISREEAMRLSCDTLEKVIEAIGDTKIKLGIETEKRLKSIDYIQKSIHAATLLGADTIVIHSGSAAKISRSEAMTLACDTLEKVIEAVGNINIRLGLETMGKLNQLGTLEEVIELCKISPKYHPVVDFGHLNARNIGSYFPDRDSYRAIFDKIATSLGDEYAFNLHCHFSKIEYTGAGEKKHLTFADEEFGPAFEPLAEAIIKDGLTPRIICESDGTMAEDALYMKSLVRR